MFRTQSWPLFFLRVVILVAVLYFMFLGVKYMFRTDDAPGPAASSPAAHQVVHYTGPMVRVRPNDQVRKPKCTSGTAPAAFFVQDKTTAVGNWVLQEKDADNWLLTFDGAAVPDGIQVATFCQ